jgi:hypothetical protein
MLNKVLACFNEPMGCRSLQGLVHPATAAGPLEMWPVWIIQVLHSSLEPTFNA